MQYYDIPMQFKLLDFSQACRCGDQRVDAFAVWASSLLLPEPAWNRALLAAGCPGSRLMQQCGGSSSRPHHASVDPGTILAFATGTVAKVCADYQADDRPAKAATLEVRQSGKQPRPLPKVQWVRPAMASVVVVV